MKRILICGAGSFIGTSFERYLCRWDGEYACDTLDTVGEGWRSFDFSGYDAVYQVAGLAHLRERPEMEESYFKINCDIAVGCAERARACGVSLFVYLSTVSVYGTNTGVLTRSTPVSPKTYYGRSKVAAEEALRALETDAFKVAILRPPMVYGYGCRGNFPKLFSLVRRTPLFPSATNRRSMIFVDNLSEFVRRLIDRGEGGLYFPQNTEYVCTADMARLMAKYSGKKLRTTGIFNGIVKRLPMGAAQKLFGDLYYDFHEDDVATVSFEESIRLSVTGK